MTDKMKLPDRTNLHQAEIAAVKLEAWNEALEAAAKFALKRETDQ